LDEIGNPALAEKGGACLRKALLQNPKHRHLQQGLHGILRQNIQDIFELFAKRGKPEWAIGFVSAKGEPQETPPVFLGKKIQKKGPGAAEEYFADHRKNRLRFGLEKAAICAA
jgi:hypothetical protein